MRDNLFQTSKRNVVLFNDLLHEVNFVKNTKNGMEDYSRLKVSMVLSQVLFNSDII